MLVYQALVVHGARQVASKVDADPRGHMHVELDVVVDDPVGGRTVAQDLSQLLLKRGMGDYG